MYASLFIFILNKYKKTCIHLLASLYEFYLHVTEGGLAREEYM